MKKVVLLLLCIFLAFPAGLADARILDSPNDLDSKLAAEMFGAAYAYFSPFDDFIYYIKSNSEGTSIVVFDAANSSYQTVKTFTPDAEYVSISVDGEGNIYLLRQDKDETAKCGILRLIKEADSYTVTEYLFPAASGELIPVSMEFSPFSSSGAVRLWLNDGGDYVPAVSILSVFWGALSGQDEIIAIQPGSLEVCVYALDELFDAYGYHNNQTIALLNKIESGELLSPTAFSLSPNGNTLLMQVPYQGANVLYAMDIYTKALEIIYTPDGFSGGVRWEEDNTLTAVSDSGEMFALDFTGFAAGDWGDDFGASWSDGFDSWGDEVARQWNDLNGYELGDWS